MDGSGCFVIIGYEWGKVSDNQELFIESQNLDFFIHRSRIIAHYL